MHNYGRRSSQNCMKVICGKLMDLWIKFDMQHIFKLCVVLLNEPQRIKYMEIKFELKTLQESCSTWTYMPKPNVRIPYESKTVFPDCLGCGHNLHDTCETTQVAEMRGDCNGPSCGCEREPGCYKHPSKQKPPASLSHRLLVRPGVSTQWT